MKQRSCSAPKTGQCHDLNHACVERLFEQYMYNQTLQGPTSHSVIIIYRYNYFFVFLGSSININNI